MSGGGEDFCEYVFNPLMRQYQAMLRLLDMMRNSQTADCNDIQCFTSNDPSNPMNSLNSTGGGSTLATFGPLLFIWALFVFALFMFRPSSMRKSNKGVNKRSGSNLNNGAVNNNRFNNDDDDNSTVS